MWRYEGTFLAWDLAPHTAGTKKIFFAELGSDFMACQPSRKKNPWQHRLYPSGENRVNKHSGLQRLSLCAIGVNLNCDLTGNSFAIVVTL